MTSQIVTHPSHYTIIKAKQYIHSDTMFVHAILKIYLTTVGFEPMTFGMLAQ